MRNDKQSNPFVEKPKKNSTFWILFSFAAVFEVAFLLFLSIVTGKVSTVLGMSTETVVVGSIVGSIFSFALAVIFVAIVCFRKAQKTKLQKALTAVLVIVVLPFGIVFALIAMGSTGFFILPGGRSVIPPPEAPEPPKTKLIHRDASGMPSGQYGLIDGNRIIYYGAGDKPTGAYSVLSPIDDRMIHYDADGNETGNPFKEDPFAAASRNPFA